LQSIARRLGDPSWLGFCLDTCHLFAAGYPLAPRRAWLQTLRQLHRYLDVQRIRAWHLNDSARPLGSRIDRHAHIGHGKIGLEGFRMVLRLPGFSTFAYDSGDPQRRFRRHGLGRQKS
jgi:deoxyribonuclease-4